MMRVFEHVDLSGRNSFHVSQRAARLIEFDKADELPALFEQYRPERWMVLSGGNNILFTCDYDGTLITPCGCEISIVAENDSEVEVEVEAGERGVDVVASAEEKKHRRARGELIEARSLAAPEGEG